MRKCLIFKLLVALTILLTPTNWCYAVPADCVTIASGVFTATVASTAIAIPRTAKRGVFVTQITAVSGTTPSMTTQYQHNISATAADFNSTSNTVSTGALTATAVRQDAYVTTGNYQMLLPYHRVSLTISGTTPSFTATFWLCYDE